MKTYQGSEIRNVAVVGHAHSGKTTLVSALLHAAKMTPTLGRVDDGSAVTAYDEEDVARGTTMQNAVAFAEWNGVKVNFIDTPGFHMFVHEARAAMAPVEAALVTVNAVTGVEPMTERVWKYAEEFNLPRAVVINQMDHPRAAASAESTLTVLAERFGRQCIPVQLPIADGKGFEGVIDLVTMEAFFYTPGGDGHGKIGEIPASLKEPAQRAHETLVELVAEGKDELMEEYFREGTIPEQHLISALHEAIREDRIFPVLYASGLANVATDHLLDFLKVYAPAPIEREPVAARAVLHTVAAAADGGGNGAAATAEGQSPEIVMRKVDDKEPLSLYVFKTMTDPFAGRISFFKVFSGVLKNEGPAQNYSRRTAEKFSHLSIMQGRNAVAVGELHAGDIGAVAKLRETLTGDTLGDKSSEMFFEPVTMPEPAMTWAIEPKSRADEDKLDAYDTLHTVLDVLCRVAAPFLPYLTEAVYRDLTGERSVHLQAWPDAAGLPYDPELVATMDLVREVASAGHSIRKGAGRRARLPLRRLTVAAPRAHRLEGFRGLLADELNVKKIDLTDAIGPDRAAEVLAVVPAALGPRLGADTQTVIKAVRTGNWEKRPDGNIEAGGIPLLEGEYSLRLRPLDERASRVLPGDAGVVTLELETDDELEAEGLARDVVRLVQQRRRDTGLEVSDRIRLTITTLPIVADAVKPWLEFVAEQVLAVGIDIAVAERVEDLVESERLPSGQEMSIDLARATD